MNEFGSTDPHEVSIPSADVTSMEVDRRCHIYINGRELPECETYGWFEAAIHEKAARERLDENGLARCGCGGKAHIINSSGYSRRLYVECDRCAIMLGVEATGDGALQGIYRYDDQIIKDWNRAMGWKGGAE